jgi:DNA-binding CsgD family transcriptional regulator
LFFDESEYAEAEGYAQKAYEKAFNTSRLSLKANALYELAKSQQAIGKFSEAFDHLKLHLLYKDSLNNINNTHKILQIYSKAELDKVMTEKKLLENQLTIKMLESSRKGHLLIGSILIILLLSSLALIMVKKYKFEKEVNKKLERQQAIINEQELIIEKEKENQLKIELEHKNRELITHTMLLTQMHEDKVKLIDELQEIYSKVSKVDKDSASVIAGRINALRNSINANTWEDFKTYFENVYTDFYSNLLAAYPNLTPNEKKLCALLRLNLNTKEIAAITSREVRSIESARTRLRKKLGLSPNTNLSIFLSKF